MSSKDLDDLFKENLGGRTFEPSSSAWESMESMISDQQLDGFVQSKLEGQVFTPSNNAWKRVAKDLQGGNPFWNNTRRMAAAITTAAGIAGAGAILWPSEQPQYAERTIPVEMPQLEENETASQLFTIKRNASTNQNLRISNGNQEFNGVSTESRQALVSTESSSILPTQTEDAYSSTYTQQNSTEELVLATNSTTQEISRAVSNSDVPSEISEAFQNSQSTRDHSNMRADEAIFEAESVMPTALFLPSKSGLLTINETELEDVPTNTVYVKEIPKRKGVIKHALGILGGVNVAQGYEGGTASGSANGNVFGGITYNYFFAPKWVLHADLLYQSRKGVETSKVLSAKTYNFGSSQDVLTMHNKTMNYLELPVNVGYRFASNWQVTAGASVAYLLACDNEMVHEHSGTFESWTRTTEETSRPDGMQNFDFALSAGLAYEIIPQLELGTRLNYGLVDVTDNDYFQHSANDNNMQWRFHIAYRFLTF
jgi:hypothetical protein